MRKSKTMGKKIVTIFEGIYPLVIYYAIISFVMEGLLHFTVLKEVSYSLPQVIAKGICIPAMLYFYHMTSHKSRLGKSSLDKVKAGAFSAILGVVFCIGFNYVIELIKLKAYSPTYRKITDAVSSEIFIVKVLAALIIAPIIEELVFRGILFFKLKCAMPRVLAVLISAAVFGTAHFNIVQGVYAFLLGIIFAVIFDMTGELWTSILAHMAANTLAFFLPATPLYKIIESASIYNHILGIGALLFGFLLLFYWKKS